MRQQFRGLAEWKAEGLPLSTPSNEAAKLYDAALTQLIGWYADENLGGIPGTMKSMLKADPEFILGICLNLTLDLMFGIRSLKTDSTVNDDLRTLERVASTNPNVTKRELKHIDAVTKYAKDEVEKAYLAWESILFDHPTDAHVVKLLTDFYFFSGLKPQFRDCVARVLPYYSQDKNPLTGYIFGISAFSLEENSLYDLAMKHANVAMELIPEDGWAHHAMGHCYETLGRTKEGIQHYEVREKDWTKAKLLVSHNNWHYALYHIERNEFEKADQIFQDRCLPIYFQGGGNLFNIIDCASYLYRLRLVDDENPREELWKKIHPRIESQLDKHPNAFGDMHLMMSCLGNKRFDQAEQLIETLDKEEPLYAVTNTILNAMYNHERGNHEKAVDLLWPAKYEIVKLGGSDAQRDVISQLLVMSAVKSPNPEHKKLAKNLLIERDQLKAVSPLNSLMRQKLENYN